MEELYYYLREWFNLKVNGVVALLGILPLTLLSVYLAYIWGYKKIKQISYLDESDIKYFRTIVYIEILLLIINGLIWLPYPIDRIFYAPFGIASSILPLLIFERIILKKYKNKGSIDILSINTQQDLDHAVKQLLDSKNFLTTLRSTLPKGDKDPEYGLDYIPYMLENIEKRKEAFSKRARAFLVTSVATGLLFVSVTIALGYFILDEDSIGTGRKIRQLKENTDVLNLKLSYITDKLLLNTTEFNRIKYQIEEVEHNLNNYKNENNKIKIRNSLNTFQRTLNLDSLYKYLDTISIPYEDDNSRLRTEYYILRDQVRNLKETSVNAVREMPELVKRINQIANEGDEEISKSDNRTPEIIKRLLLSLVIISFFLAILRFLTNQYKNNFNQLILAEQDDLNIRKMYIAIRTAGSDIDSKKIILSNIFDKVSIIEKKESESNDNLPLIKELMETLAKKL